VLSAQASGIVTRGTFFEMVFPSPFLKLPRHRPPEHRHRDGQHHGPNATRMTTSGTMSLSLAQDHDLRMAVTA
jgi:hypothetical protein